MHTLNMLQLQRQLQIRSSSRSTQYSPAAPLQLQLRPPSLSLKARQQQIGQLTCRQHSAAVAEEDPGGAEAMGGDTAVGQQQCGYYVGLCLNVHMIALFLTAHR